MIKIRKYNYKIILKTIIIILEFSPNLNSVLIFNRKIKCNIITMFNKNKIISYNTINNKMQIK